MLFSSHEVERIFFNKRGEAPKRLLFPSGLNDEIAVIPDIPAPRKAETFFPVFRRLQQMPDSLDGSIFIPEKQQSGLQRTPEMLQPNLRPKRGEKRVSMGDFFQDRLPVLADFRGKRSARKQFCLHFSPPPKDSGRGIKFRGFFSSHRRFKPMAGVNDGFIGKGKDL